MGQSKSASLRRRPIRPLGLSFPYRPEPPAQRKKTAQRKKIPAEAGIFKKCGNHLLSPCDYHRPCRLNFRVRDGNGCDPACIVTAPEIIAELPTASSVLPTDFARKKPARKPPRPPHLSVAPAAAGRSLNSMGAGGSSRVSPSGRRISGVTSFSSPRRSRSPCLS